MSLAILLLSLSTSVDPATLRDNDLHQAMAALGEAIVDAHTRRNHWDPRAMPGGESTRQLDGGYTALATLALLIAGHDAQSAPLDRALRFLADLDPRGTYTVAFRTQTWAMLPDTWHAHLERDVQRLCESFNLEAGGWDYACTPTKRIRRASPSVRHVALLALWSAARRGVTVPRRILDRIEEVTLSTQLDDGGWSYGTAPGASGSMTAAGVFSLVMIEDLTRTPRTRSRGTALRTRAIDRGLAWLDERFDAGHCPGGGRCGGFPMYWLYALERVALATGRRRLANTDWFRAAAASAIGRLCRRDAKTPGSSWIVRQGSGTSRLRQQCFALMLLHRGRVPLAASHLVLPGAPDRDAVLPRFIEHLEELHEHEAAWQTVTLDDDIDAWLESPMLVVIGREAIRAISTRRREIDAHLRDSTNEAPNIPLCTRIGGYLERGGLVVALSEGGMFAGSIRRLGSMAANHAIWKSAPRDHRVHELLASVAGSRPRVEVLASPVRDLVYLIHAGRSAPGLRAGTSPAAATVMTNAWALATERHPFPPRLDAGAGGPSPDVGTPSNLAVRHIGFVDDLASNPEPGAADGLARWARRRGLPLHVHALEATDPTDGDCPVVIVAGATAPQARQAWPWIHRRLQLGLVVLVADAGGSGQFTSAVAQQASIDSLEVHPVRSGPVVTGDGLPGGLNLERPRWRPFSRQKGLVTGGLDLRSTPDGRLWLVGVDVVHAMLDRPWWGVHGVMIDTAGGLAWNLVQWTHSRRRSPEGPRQPEADRGASLERLDPDRRGRSWTARGPVGCPGTSQSSTGRWCALARRRRPRAGLVRADSASARRPVSQASGRTGSSRGPPGHVGLRCGSA